MEGKACCQKVCYYEKNNGEMRMKQDDRSGTEWKEPVESGRRAEQSEPVQSGSQTGQDEAGKTGGWPEQNMEKRHAGHPAEQHNPVHAPVPGLGLRSMKTALAAALTALLYAFLPESNPTFACIGAIFGMGADMEESRRSGGNRFFGTIIGGFTGLGLYWAEHVFFPEGCYWLRLPLVFLGIVVMILLCVLLHWPGGVQPGGVVLCIILFNTPPHHIDYAINRMIDTGIGVVIALLVNYFLPRSRLERWFHLEQKGKRGKGAQM